MAVENLSTGWHSTGGSAAWNRSIASWLRLLRPHARDGAAAPECTRNFAAAHAIPPFPELRLLGEKTGALGSQSEKREHWCRVKVGQTDGGPGQPGRYIDQLGQCR